VPTQFPQIEIPPAAGCLPLRFWPPRAVAARPCAARACGASSGPLVLCTRLVTAIGGSGAAARPTLSITLAVVCQM